MNNNQHGFTVNRMLDTEYDVLGAYRKAVGYNVACIDAENRMYHTLFIENGNKRRVQWQHITEEVLMALAETVIK